MNICRFVLLSFLAFAFSALLSSCSSTPSDAKEVETISIPVDDKAEVEEERARMLEQLRIEKACCLKLMGNADTEQALVKFKKELDRINADIQRLETDVPKDIQPPKTVDITVSKETYEIINSKKDRLAEIQLEREFLTKTLEKSESLNEITTVKELLDHLDGEDQNLRSEITALEHESVNQDKFIVQKMVVYGPLGWALKLVEIILDRLFIMFVW